MFTMTTLAYLLLTLHMFVGLFMIVLVLLQRGRGGGLAGAFGGMGGQSAFGNKAGDFFTKLTIGVATFWILLGCICVLVVNAASRPSTPSIFKEGTKANDEEVTTAPAIRDGTAPATGNDKKKGDDSTGTENPKANPKSEESDPKEKNNKDDKGTDEKASDKGSADGNKPAENKKSDDDKKPSEQEPPKDTPKLEEKKPADQKEGDKKDSAPKLESGDKPAEKTEKPE